MAGNGPGEGSLGPASHAPRPVTARQRQLLAGLIEGLSLRRTGEVMGISESTTRKHVRALHVNIGTHNLHGLAAWGVRHWGCCIDPGNQLDAGVSLGAVIAGGPGWSA